MKLEKCREEIIRYSFKCDICGKDNISPMTCDICGRDTCHSCSKIDPRDTEDYSRKYCVDCFNIGENYLKRIKIEEDKLEKLEEELEQKWRHEALISVKKLAKNR